MCSSTVAAEEIQMQRLRQNEPGMPNVQNSDRCFRFADGETDAAQKMVEQPITAGLLQGKSIKMHVIDRAGNETSPVFSIDGKRRHRMVVDYEENHVMFKDKPDVWHELPVTKKGLMMLPLTKEACERHALTHPPPPPEPPKDGVRLRSARRRKTACRAEACTAESC